MELDELKQAWQTLDARLKKQNELQLAELRERKFDRVKASLRLLGHGQTVQILLGIIIAGFVLPLWEMLNAPTPLLVASVIFTLYGVAIIVAAGVVLGHIAQIDRSLAVLELQQRLLRLRKAYIISGMVAGLPWWLLWMVPPMVVASLQNAQNGSEGLPAWLWICIGTGLIGLLGTWGFILWARKPGREALATRVEDGLAGGSLRKAQAELDALKRYTEE